MKKPHTIADHFYQVISDMCKRSILVILGSYAKECEPEFERLEVYEPT